MAKEKGRVLPYLSKDIISERDEHELILDRDLSHCWRGDDFDMERAEHLLHAAVVTIFDVEFYAYREKPGYEPSWIEYIMDESACRVLLHAANHRHWSDGVALYTSLMKTLINHLKHNSVLATGEFEAAFPEKQKPVSKAPVSASSPISPPPLPPYVQEQMAASGIDITSGSPLLIMAAAAARSASTVPQPQTPKQPTFSEELGRLLIEARWKPDVIAEKVGIVPRNVYRHLSGETKPTLTNIGGYEAALTKKLGRKIELPTPVKRHRVSKTSAKRQ